MPKSFYQQAKFLTSAAALSQLPEDVGAEVAFLGRSNVGKSSCLNALTQQKSLARVSKTPGRTQLVNFFECPENVRLVDLPGYGYAKVTGHTQKLWEHLIEDYLRMRKSLRGLILIMDIRHPLQDLDKRVLHWCVDSEIPTHIILNKADKFGFGAQKQTLMKVVHYIKKLDAHLSVQTFSATKHNGIDELVDLLDEWLLA